MTVGVGGATIIDMSLSRVLGGFLPAAGGPIESLAPSATRDCVRLLEVDREGGVRHHMFYDLAKILRPGDLLVVNDSATVCAAIAGHSHELGEVLIHLSSIDPTTGNQLVEVRKPYRCASREIEVTHKPFDVQLDGGGRVHILAADLSWDGSGRIRSALLELSSDLAAYCAEFGSPIRYSHVTQPWRLDAYQTVFADKPGGSEMPSAARPFSWALVDELLNAGVAFARVTLHTGVASLSGSELPRPEPYAVTLEAADLINESRSGHGRVIAVGTSVVRTLTASIDDEGLVRPGSGFAHDLIGITSFPKGLCDGLITGWHDPAGSHLMLLRQLASNRSLIAGYAAAELAGYKSHEFGDSNLIWL